MESTREITSDPCLLSLLPAELIEELSKYLRKYSYILGGTYASRAAFSIYKLALAEDGHCRLLNPWVEQLQMTHLNALLSKGKPESVQWVLNGLKTGEFKWNIINKMHIPGSTPPELVPELAKYLGVDNYVANAITSANLRGVQWALKIGHKLPSTALTGAFRSGSPDMLEYVLSLPVVLTHSGPAAPTDLVLVWAINLNHSVTREHAKTMLNLAIWNYGIHIDELTLKRIYMITALHCSSLVPDILDESEYYCDDHALWMYEHIGQLPVNRRLRYSPYPERRLVEGRPTQLIDHHDLLHWARYHSREAMLASGRWKLSRCCTPSNQSQ